MSGEPRAPIIIIGDPNRREPLPPEVEKERRDHMIFFAIIIIAGVAALWFFLRPGDGLAGGRVLTYEEGVPVSVFLDKLESQSIIRSPLLARLLVRVYGNENKISAGEYFFPDGSWLPAIAKQLAKSDHRIPTMKVTFPEGTTVKEMAEIIHRSIGDFDTATFIKDGEQKEGYLFPNTYEFFATVKPEKVIEMLNQEFNDQVTPHQGEITAFGRSLEDIVVMASILEGEVKTPKDRAIVAGILWKRLDRGMPLQVDATFAYLLGKGSSELSIKDLSVDSPFNTYRNKGLPPSPINNPGLEALLAAAHPEDSPYFFYLSDKNGTIHYAKTFDEHKDNKAKYLR